MTASDMIMARPGLVTGVGMADAKSREEELQLLWAEYEAAMWVGLTAVKDQAMITGTKLEELSAAQRKAIRILSRLRELTAA